MNYFANRAVADSYARGRPYMHPVAIALIRERLGLTAPLPVALDICCGTGQSSRALETIATRVIGLDGAPDMVAHAVAEGGPAYTLGDAERLPIRDSAAPLLTVVRAMHWLNHDRFLAEARRVLQPGGWLITYGSRLQPESAPTPAFVGWYEHARARLPRMPRNDNIISDDLAAAHGFVRHPDQPFTHTMSLTVEAMVTNVLSASGAAALDDDERAALSDELRRTLAEILPSGAAEFGFAGTIAYWRREPESARPR